MNHSDIAKIKQVLLKTGDSFWSDANDGDNDNRYLVDEIVELLNKEGLDLKLISTINS